LVICPQKLPDLMTYNREGQRSATNKPNQNKKFWHWD